MSHALLPIQNILQNSNIFIGCRDTVLFTSFGKKKVTQFSGLPPTSVSYLNPTYSERTFEKLKAMFTLYRIGFCSVSKVAQVQCEQELMFCCGAEIVPKRSQCEQKPYPLCNLQRSLLI